MPPRYAKSTCVSIMWPTWVWAREAFGDKPHDPVLDARDLTVGDLVAQVAHAAGESFYVLERTPIEHVVADHDVLVSQRLEQSVF
jgi:hypothetical protein